MNNNEIIISDLEKVSLSGEHISDQLHKTKWTSVPYESSFVSGRLLLAGEMTSPPEITLRLRLYGKYKIFVGTLNMKSANYFMLRLSSDRSFTAMRNPTVGSKHRWTPVEYFEEFYWRSCELSGEDLILKKPEAYFDNAASLAWIRLVPISDEEWINEISYSSSDVIHTHIDEDPNAEQASDSDEELLTRHSPLMGGDVASVSYEISFDYDTPEYGDCTNLLRKDAVWQSGDESFVRVKDRAYKLRVNEAHRSGRKIYAANRMSVAAFTPPYTNQQWCRKSFVESHPEYYCKTRDGRTVNACSYAFPEVRSFVVNTLASHMKYGFDGVTLIFHRGIHIGFEEPVKCRFRELYPEVDPKRLPFSDPRLSRVLCEFMTAFMRELKSALGDREINIITEYTPETSRNFGIDVEELARLGLVSSVYQGIMEVCEDLDGCLASDGLIDMNLYKNKLKSEPIIKRYHHTSIEKTIDGAKKYLEILKDTEVRFAATLPWPHRVSPEEYGNWKSRLREIGVNEFLSWNTNHLMYDLPELHAMMYDTRAVTPEKYTVNRYRTLSLFGSDISTFDPNWRG